MKKALILLNAYSQLQSFLFQSQRLKEELEKLGVDVEIKRNDGFFSYVADGGALVNKIKNYDFCIYLDKDKYMSQMLQKSGMRMFNAHEAIQRCDDKMTTGILLADSGLPMPKTLAGLLCYDLDKSVKEDALRIIAEELGFPLIVKTCYGSLGKGVYKVDNISQLCDIAEKVKGIPHLFQKYVSQSCGKDIRVVVIGGKAFAGMQRKSNNDFRSNIELGGVGEAIDLPQAVIDMSEKAARLLGLDYCGVDILIGDEGYYICEVNSNAFFGGIERVTGKNVAQKYAQHIYESVYGKVD